MPLVSNVRTFKCACLHLDVEVVGCRRSCLITASVRIRLAFILLLTPAAATAQTGTSLAVGAGLNVYKPISAATSATPSIAFVYRWIPADSGWRPAIGFNWYTVEPHRTVGLAHVPLGALRLRPVMGGYGYVSRMQRVTWSATGFAGVSFNSFEPSNAARLAFNDQLARVLLDADAAFGPAAKAELSVAYDLNHRVGVMASVASLFARSRITLATDLGPVYVEGRADALQFLFGATVEDLVALHIGGDAG